MPRPFPPVPEQGHHSALPFGWYIQRLLNDDSFDPQCWSLWRKTTMIGGISYVCHVSFCGEAWPDGYRDEQPNDDDQIDPCTALVHIPDDVGETLLFMAQHVHTRAAWEALAERIELNFSSTFSCEENPYADQQS